MSDKTNLKQFFIVCKFLGPVLIGAAGGEIVRKSLDPQGGVEPDPVISPIAQTVLVGLCIRELATTLSDKKSAKQITDLANQIMREAAN